MTREISTDEGTGSVSADAIPGENRCDVCVVIVTYNGARWIEDCLRSVQAAAPAASTIVVDNASTDDTVRICRTVPDVTIIENRANLGFGIATNLGISIALSRSAQWVLVLNQDTVVDADMVTRLLEAAKWSPEIGIVCPIQWNRDYSSIDPTFLQCYAARYAPAMLSDALRGQPRDCYVVESMPAAAWLMSSQCLLRVGGFDPLFFMYGEDDDLTARAAYHGYKLAVVPAARFAHIRGFHGDTGAPTAPRRLRTLARRMRSDFVLEAKQIRGNFAKNTWRAATDLALRGVRALALYGDVIQFLAAITAVLVEAKRLPTIWRHRERCRTGGPLWIDGEWIAATRTKRLAESTVRRPSSCLDSGQDQRA